MQKFTGGQNGVTLLVKSLVDGKLYVRKQFKEDSSLIPAEVSVYDHIPQAIAVPQLIFGYRCGKYRQLSGTSSRSSYDIWTLYFNYCNGGNLGMLLDRLRDGRSSISEVFIWHFLAELSRTVAGFHLPIAENPDGLAVIHGDLHAGNVYLHWPSPDTILPNILVGDFGSAEMVSHDDSAMQPSRPLLSFLSSHSTDRNMTDEEYYGDVEDDNDESGPASPIQDIADIGALLICFVDKYNIDASDPDSENGDGGSWQDRFPAHYSEDLFEWCIRLTRTEPYLPTASQLLAELVPVAQAKISQLMATTTSEPIANFQWTMPMPPETPLRFLETQDIFPSSVLGDIDEMQTHWEFQTVTVSDEAYEDVWAAEDTRRKDDVREGYTSSDLLGYAARTSPFCRCHQFAAGDGDGDATITTITTTPTESYALSPQLTDYTTDGDEDESNNEK